MPSVGNVGFSQEKRGPEKREIRFVSLATLWSFASIPDSFTIPRLRDLRSGQIYRLKTELARCKQWPLRVKGDCR